MLNKDGSRKLDKNGEWINAYTNDEIMSFARLWTGFDVSALLSLHFVILNKPEWLTCVRLFTSPGCSTNNSVEILKTIRGLATESTQ